MGILLHTVTQSPRLMEPLLLIVMAVGEEGEEGEFPNCSLCLDVVVTHITSAYSPLARISSGGDPPPTARGLEHRVFCLQKKKRNSWWSAPGMLSKGPQNLSSSQDKWKEGKTPCHIYLGRIVFNFDLNCLRCLLVASYM